jgi:hypothetical protein
MAYTHKHWAEKRHRWSKHTNLQNGIDLPPQAFDGELTRTLSNWEWAELKELCDTRGLDLPARTLAGFIAIAGRAPTYLENGQWITPPPLKETK